MKKYLILFIIIALYWMPTNILAIELNYEEVVNHANELFSEDGWLFIASGGTEYNAIIVQQDGVDVALYSETDLGTGVFTLKSEFDKSVYDETDEEFSKHVSVTKSNRLLLYSVLDLYYDVLDYDILTYINYDAFTLDDNGIFISSEYIGSKINAYDTEFIIDINNIDISDYIQSIDGSVYLTVEEILSNIYTTNIYSYYESDNFDFSVMSSGGTGFDILLINDGETNLFALSNQNSYHYSVSLTSITEDEIELYEKTIEILILGVLDTAYSEVFEYELDGTLEFDYSLLSLEDNGIYYNKKLQTDGTYNIELDLALERIKLDSDIEYFISTDEDVTSLVDAKTDLNTYLYYLIPAVATLLVISIGVFVIKNVKTK